MLTPIEVMVVVLVKSILKVVVVVIIILVVALFKLPFPAKRNYFKLELEYL